MNYSVVYSSRTGNTKLLAEKIRKTLPSELCQYFGEDDEKALDSEMIYVGFWTDKGRADEKTEEFLKTLTNQKVFLFGTAGFGGSKEYFDKIINETKKNLKDTVEVTGAYMCQGKMPAAVRTRYEAMLNDASKKPVAENLIKNFDSALSHPDEKDLDELSRVILK